MKVRVEMTVDIDVDAWRRDMMADAHASTADVRRDVQNWAHAEIRLGLVDRSLTKGNI